MENQNTGISVEKKIDETRILSLRFKRTNSGIEIQIQSNVDWGFLGNPKRKFNLAGVECAAPMSLQQEGVNSYFSPDQTFSYEGMPNLTMLLATNIRSGVKFVFPTMPISDEKIKMWTENFKEDVKILYLTFCKPVDISVEINSRTVEREIHD